jgi:hypothetical protein
MKICKPLVATSLIIAGTLSLAAQQPVAVSTTVRAGSSSTVMAKAMVQKGRTDAFTMIQGNALNSTNGAMNDVLVRLRDARFGRIVDTQLTDKSGLFSFKAIDPGTYIVEMMSNNESVLAASQLLNVNAGEAVSAVVKLPFRIPPFAGVLGTSSTPTASVLTAQAAASSIAAVVPTAPISPTR